MIFARKPLVIVEIDVDQCTRNYASAPCAAVLGSTGVRKCFNTFATCQDPANFEKGVLTLRFAFKQSDLPKDGTYFPALTSVSERPGDLNLSGIDPKTSALGKRARVSVNLLDFAYHDGLTDPYRAERVSGAAQASGIGYDPKSRGTFFARLVARAPYYIGRPLRVLRGYEGDALVDMEVAHYVVSEWSGPNARGAVSIEAKDVLDLVDGKRTQAPAPTRGELSEDITEVADELTLSPSGIGDLDYAASGFVTVDREVMQFTRSGDVLTLVDRAVLGTERKDHSAGAGVQQALYYEGQTISAIAADLLTIQGPVPASFVDLPSWEDEAIGWVSARLTGIVVKPTSIAELIGELCQHGVMIWWSSRDQMVRFRANRPKLPDEAYIQLNDDGHLIEGSIDTVRNEDQRISTLYFYHGVLDPTDSTNDASNYSRLVIAADPSSASANEHNEERIKKIFSRWFGRFGNDAQASVVSERLVSRYRNTPRQVEGLLDVKDMLSLADLVQITTHVLVDDVGEALPVTSQINHVTPQGDRLYFRAEEYPIENRFGFLVLDSANDYDVATDEEKETGCYMIDDAIGDLGDGSPNYVMF